MFKTKFSTNILFMKACFQFTEYYTQLLISYYHNGQLGVLGGLAVMTLARKVRASWIMLKHLVHSLAPLPYMAMHP